MDVLGATEVMAQKLKELRELRVFDYDPDTVSPPAAIIGFPFNVMEGDQLTRRRPASNSLYRWPVPVRLILGRSSERYARQKFQEYQSGVVDKLMQLDRNGLCHLHVQRISAIRPVQYAGASYWVCDVVMEVWA